MITRRIASLLRGQATPLQLVLACVLGALLGFAPGLLQAPALVLLLVAALLVANANLGLALLVAALARLLALAAAPLSFQIGRFLLEGPTEPVARAVVNAPFFAWAGLQYYAVSGGLVLGLALGLALGLVVASAVARFRRRMAARAQAPSRWREVSSKPWARAALWLFFGPAGKGTWEEKLGRRYGNPVRIWGAALLVLFVAGLYVAHRQLLAPLARRGLTAGLEQANGATVDVGPLVLDLREGRFAVSELALADPSALELDLFRAAHLEADVHQADLLRRRVHVARVVVSEAQSGVRRAVPGEAVAPPAKKVYEATRERLPPAGDFSLEEVLAEVETWKERLAQARRWLDRLSGPPIESLEELRERLEREVLEGGWLSVQAGHLRDEAPAFRLSELLVDGLESARLPGRVFDLAGYELSSHPWLLDAPPRLELASRDGEIRFAVDLGPVSRGGGPGGIVVSWKNLEVDEVMGELELPGGPPFRGGTLDLALDGAWAGERIGWIDLPLRVTLRDTEMRVAGGEPTRIPELVLPIGLSGPIDAPRIHFDASVLADALAAAGKRELASRVRERLGEELGELEERTGVELPEGLDEKLPGGTRGALEGLLGGRKGERKNDEERQPR